MVAVVKIFAPLVIVVHTNRGNIVINIKTIRFVSDSLYKITAIHKTSRTKFVNSLKVGDVFRMVTKLHGNKTQAGYLAPQVRLYFPDKKRYTKWTTQHRMQEILKDNFSAEIVERNSININDLDFANFSDIEDSPQETNE